MALSKVVAPDLYLLIGGVCLDCIENHLVQSSRTDIILLPVNVHQSQPILYNQPTLKSIYLINFISC